MTSVPVFHLARGREWRGGERQVWLLARAQWTGQEVLPRVATAGGGRLARALRSSGVPVAPLPWRLAHDPRGLWRLAGELEAAIRRGPVSPLLHAHDSHALAFALLVGRRYRLPVVATRRSMSPPGRLWRRPARVIALSEAVAGACRAAGIPAGRLHVIPSAVDPAVLDAPAALAADPSRPGILAVGALTAEKGHRTLVEAFAQVVSRHPGCRLVLVGEGPERPALEQLARRLGVARSVELTGELPSALPRFATASLLVQPSHREALGTAVLEAMALGVPVVASATGGLAEVATPDRALAVPPGDPAALAAAILAVLGDPAAARARAGAARRFARALTPDGVAAQVAAVYRSALRQP